MTPVVGMVGAGQLARMTYQASIPLGIGFRVLADRPDDSAALVCPDTTVGDYHRLDDLLNFAAGCDVVTFDHEHVPGEHLAALAGAGVAVAPGGAALRYAQDKLAMRDELSRLGAPCPRYAPVASPEDVAGFAAERGLAGGAEGGPGRLRRPRRLGVRGTGSGGRGAGVRGAPARRGACPVRPRAGRAGGQVPAPAGGGLPGRADRAARRGLPGGARARARAGRGPRRGRGAAGPGTRGRARGDRPAGRGAVRDPARPAGERAGHAAAQQRSLDHRGSRDLPVRAASAGRAGPAAGRAAAGRAARGHG